jgi:outer membrane protein TolC
MREISDALHTARTTFERGTASYRASQSAKSAYEGEQKRLAGGTSTLLNVLLLQEQWVNSRATWLRACADYNQALARLHFADASILESHDILLVRD